MSVPVLFVLRREILLNLDLGAGSLEFLGELLSVFLGDGFLDGLGSVVNQFLGFLQAQAGSGADDLDDVQLGSASGLQNDVELSLLFDFGSTGSGTGSNSGSGGGDTEGLFQGMNRACGRYRRR